MRRLHREDCLFRNGVYVKDLRRLNTDLKDVVIVDNSPFSFMLQPENAILCPSFYGDKNDTYLRQLMPYMRSLGQCADVRQKIKEYSQAMASMQGGEGT